MPRAPWRRRRTTDSPRPAGRWTGKLRRGGSLARQVLLVRVGRRRRNESAVTSAPAGRFLRPDPTIIPVSPAVPMPAGGPPSGPMSIPMLPGDRTVARRVRFAAANACTLASLALGLFAIFLAMQGGVQLAAVCLIACVGFDGLDGALARRLGVASPFGAQMDSLADMCSFGVAAPIVVYASLADRVPTAAAAVACALVAGCAAIRLARFNVSPKDGRFFCGVPTTMAAAVLALAVLIGLPLSGGWQLAGVAVLAFAMVSSFPYAKIARLVKLPLWLLVLPVIGALVDARITFGLAVAAYLASGPLIWLHRRRVAGAGFAGAGSRP
ncbi:MAG TPA: CDP-alcohol phosphatidyltransferase family protein [Micromonosporaceae bacterium]|nr:CDP-alcohol phosphatidyltransferase family protein [Micromonosporaceae bacterium]